MTMHTDTITLHPDDELAKRLKEAAGQPVVIEHNGVRYRIEPEDPFAFYDTAPTARGPSQAHWPRRGGR